MYFRLGKEIKILIPEWTSVLKLSTMWEFDRIRKIAIDQMSDLPMGVVEKIVIARDYHVTKWFLPSLVEYARLERPVSAEDVDHLGLEYLLKIVQTQQSTITGDQLFTPKAKYQCTRCLSSKVNNKTGYADVLRVVFQDENERVKKTWSMNRTSTDLPVYVTTETKSI
jgi:hypothetical protein